MYFILSKVLLFLITPVYWICILLLIAAFTNRRKLRKHTAIAGLILLYIFSNTWLLNVCANSWEYKQVKLPDTAHYSCVIVLGGFSSPVEGKEGRFNGVSDRFIQGMKLVVTGKASHILITGGSGSLRPDEFSEGEWVRGQLKEFKLADSTILIEGKSRNTMENARFSAEILKKSGLKPPYLLVTSAMHMRRSVMIFNKNNVPIVPFPADFITHKIHPPTFWDLIPEFSAITWWDGMIKEIFGYVVNGRMK